MTIDQAILTFIGKIIAYGGGGAVVAYWLFKYLTEKWIENKFAQRLQEYKHRQDKELEELRYKINALLNRVTKIHEKEFEVLPTAWQKLSYALGLISSITTLFQSYPNLNIMEENELKEFLSRSKLAEFQKKKLLQEKDKTEYYIKTIFWHNLNDAETALVDFHNYIATNKIFLSIDMYNAFKKVDDIMWEIFLKRRISEEGKDRDMGVEAYRKIRDEVSPMLKEVEEQVQKRLQFKEA